MIRYITIYAIILYLSMAYVFSQSLNIKSGEFNSNKRNANSTSTTIVNSNHSRIGYKDFNANNNRFPEIIKSNYLIQKSNINNGLIGKVHLSEHNSNLTYSIVGGTGEDFFQIDANTGLLYLAESKYLTDEGDNTFTLDIKVANTNLYTVSAVTVTLLAEKNVIYIDPDNFGDPDMDGTIEHPFCTWADIEWKDEMSYLQKSGTQANEDKILIQANHVALGCYGYGDKPVINSTTRDYAMKVYNKTNVLISSLHIKTEDALGSIYILGNASNNIQIEACRFEQAQYGLRIIEGTNINISYNKFEDQTEGIYSLTEDIHVAYNVFSDNGTAINLASYLSSATIINNVFYNNRIAVSASYASVELYNNIFYLAQEGDIAINHELDNLLSDYNIFYPEQDGFITINGISLGDLREYREKHGLDLHSYISNPKFVDMYLGNFSISENSPAINAGKNLGYHVDYLGQQVPYGNKPDIGVIELQSDPRPVFTNSENALKRFGITIFPNPSDGRFFLDVEENHYQECELQIINSNGQTVYNDSNKISEVNKYIDISYLPFGVYQLLLKVGKTIYAQPIVFN